MKLRDIERRFDLASRDYDNHDALEREVGERLLERLGFARIAPHCVLDLGCGTGRDTNALKARFPTARVVGYDISMEMLGGVVGRSSGAHHLFAVQGDLTRLPFAAGSADLIFCNLAIQWAGDFAEALKEFRRVLKPGAMLLFSVPGPESLRELRVIAAAEQGIPIYMPDLQEVGDLLLSVGFSEPVMDSEALTISYPDPQALMDELAVTGGAGFAQLELTGNSEVKFEVVYGTAFGAPEGQPVRTPEGEVATFSVNQIRRR